MTPARLSGAEKRVYDALDAIAADGWPVTVREIAAATSLAISTVHVYLHLLEAQGLAEQHPRNDRGGWKP